jgi:hypothetical protein
MLFLSSQSPPLLLPFTAFTVVSHSSRSDAVVPIPSNISKELCLKIYPISLASNLLDRLHVDGSEGGARGRRTASVPKRHMSVAGGEGDGHGGAS